MANMNYSDQIEQAFAPFSGKGGETYFGEDITQLEHACQAAQLAERQGENEEVILAAFFHDIGHICPQPAATGEMAGYGKMNHEKTGGDFLRSLGFPARMAKLVESHVLAKRYLTFANPTYLPRLSEASRQTLEFQGGPMRPMEAMAFESDPDFKLILRMRTWDEAAKEQGLPLPDLQKYKDMAARILAAH